VRITEIYKNYDIPENLQIHMLRVASVAMVICENLKSDLSNEEKENIVKASLLHDMGNIIKFNLELFPQFLEPQGLAYWSGIKQDFINKYGNDEHKATSEIAKEIGVGDRVLELINSVGFTKAKENFESADIAKMICCYSDQRVAPTGVKSLQQRIDEGLGRYMKNRDLKEVDREKFITSNKFYGEFLKKMEVKVFKNSKVEPGEINDEMISKFINNLKNSEI
jgi:hypothetical protein